MASTSEMEDTGKKSLSSKKKSKSVGKSVTRSTTSKGTDQGGEHTPLPSQSKKRKLLPRDLRQPRKARNHHQPRLYRKKLPRHLQGPSSRIY